MSASSVESFTDFEDLDAMSEMPDSPPKSPILVASNAPSIEKASPKSHLPPSTLLPGIKHARFCFEDANVTFLVEGFLYCVPKYFFRRDSLYFRTLFLDHPDKGADLATPIRLDDVKCSEFDALLSILYPMHFHECELKTVEAWTSVLRLSTEWSFPSLRTLAIDRLLPIASPVDKVVLGRTYGIDAWLQPGFVALCDRPQLPTMDEAIRLGFRDTMLIMAVRESMRSREPGWPTDEIEHVVGTHLNPEENEAVERQKVDDEVVAGKRAHEEAVKRKKVFEEAAAKKKKADQEAAARRRAEAEHQKRIAEESAARKKADKEAAFKKWEAEHRMAEEDAAAQKKLEEAVAKKKAEELTAKQRDDEAVAKKKADDEAAARKKEDDAAALKSWEEEYDRKEAEVKNADPWGMATKTGWGKLSDWGAASTNNNSNNWGAWGRLSATDDKDSDHYEAMGLEEEECEKGGMPGKKGGIKKGKKGKKQAAIDTDASANRP
ncbi:hypothetical protein EVG20_g8146 [Dentipellis fragilis]|uniref:BTB domain-containing protein n=1 Tax=Dentipellis fragilis TaxID=205917 RepID=A0A4Y9YAH1_9AGAM|nr:hypothetical protein EVG20_g8146 [Dentipellis fragilis]